MPLIFRFAISFTLTNAGDAGWIVAYTGHYEKSLQRSSSGAAGSIAQVTRKKLRSSASSAPAELWYCETQRAWRDEHPFLPTERHSVFAFLPFLSLRFPRPRSGGDCRQSRGRPRGH